MPAPEEIAQQQERLETYRRRLAYQVEQQALLGASAPFILVEDIRTARDAIRSIKATLRGWGALVEDHPDDEPPMTNDQASPPGDAGSSLLAPAIGDIVGGDKAEGDKVMRDKVDARQYHFYPGQPAPARVPTCPQPNAAILFGRDETIADLAQRLTTGAGTVAISAVRGLPGVGKTDLLRAVGNDAHITAHFAGGVLYAELGPTPDLSQVLRRWVTALGHEPPRSDDPETLAGALRPILQERRALLILDDVWDTSLRMAKALRDCGSAECRVLISGRSAAVVQELARGIPPLTLGVLSPSAALDLLHQSARDGEADIIARDEAGAAELAEALGYLPLALKLAGGWLRANHRQPRYRARPCAGLLGIWRAKLDELRGHEQRPGLEPEKALYGRPSVAAGQGDGSRPSVAAGQGADDRLSLDAIIGLSYAALPDDATRAAAAALAAFGATPLDWDWDAMAAVWQTGEDATAALEQALIASGLLDYDADSGRYSQHQTVQAFLERRCDPTFYERHAEYYAGLMQKCNREIQHESTIDVALATLDRAIGQMERGQQRAANSEPTPFWDARLIGYAFASHTYLRLRGRYNEAIAWSEAARQAAQRQGRERDVAGFLNNIAIVYWNTDRYDEAIVAYKEAINAHRALNNEAGLAIALGNLGVVYKDQRRYDEAIDHHQQSLEIRRRIGDVAGIAIDLINLGVVYQSQGRYDEAIDHHQQSLEISRRIGDVAGIALILGNLGLIYNNQGRYDEAIDHYHQSLVISRRIGDLATTAGLLRNLGVVYRNQGRYNEAIDHHQQSLEISRRIGNVSTTAMNVWNLGLLYEQQGNLAAALPLIDEAAQIAERIGMPQAAEYRAKAEELRARIERGTPEAAEGAEE